MRRLCTFALLAIVVSIAKSQDIDTGTGFIGNGYYRIHNLATQRYIYVTDNKDYYDITHDKEDFQAIQLWKNIEKAIYDPASVVYITQRNDVQYDLTGQGTGVHSLTGYYVNVSKKTDNTYEVSASKDNVTKYLYDGKSSSTAQQGTLGTSGKDISYRRWIVDKIDTNHAINYVGIKPTIELNGVYYQPFYAAFPFRAVSPDMHIYYITAIGGEIALLQEIEGDVPAGTPVIIECASAEPSDNRIELLVTTSATVSGNKLSGVYFCNGKRPKESKDAYKKFDAATMRIFTVANGKLVLSNQDESRLNNIKVNDYTTYTQVDALCLYANTSYLPADANTPDVIELTSDPTSINGIAAGKKVSGKGIYSVSGTLLRPTSDTAGLPAGLYIIDGKKVAVK